MTELYPKDSPRFLYNTSFACLTIDLHHLGVGTSSRPSSDIYTGPRPFSEKVTHNVAKYLYKRRLEIKGYIDFHAYAQMWLSPWGYTTAYPPNYNKQVRGYT